MNPIVPAILPTSRLDLEAKVSRIAEVEDITAVQLDIVDGRFAFPASWPYTEDSAKLAETLSSGAGLPFLGRISYEIDLMVSHPEEVVGSWITLGASRITVHIESTKYLTQLFADMHKRFGYDKDFAPDLLSLGVAIGASTDLAILEPHIEHLDYVQFMGIKNIGKQGQPFDPDVLKRIALFRKRHPQIEIQVDGGVTRTTAPALLQAGVDRLIVGSALQNASDLKAEHAAFTELTEEYGIYE